LQHGGSAVHAKCLRVNFVAVQAVHR